MNDVDWDEQKESGMRRTFLAVLILFGAALSAGDDAWAQSSGSGSSQTQTYSGYPPSNSLEGGDSVVQDLSIDDTKLDPVLSFPKIEKFFQPFFDWKKRLNENTGLKLQFSYQTLYQRTDEPVTYEDAFAGRGQIQGSWTLLNRGGENEGRLTFRLENRHTINSAIPPSQLAFQFGSIAPSGTGFSDFGTVLTELAWRQSLMDGKFRFIVGKISAISWYNVHAMSSSMRGFQNTALQSSLSKPAPGRGIGAGFGYEFTPHFVMVAGIHDANAKTDENPFDTIGEKEFYSSVEFRYYPTTPDRWRYDQVRLQFWYQDPKTASGTPAGYGATFTASHLFQDRYYPFVVAGISNGKASTFKKDVIAGLGIGLDTKHRAASDLIGLAVSWGDPSNAALQDQTTAELFYRFQLAQRLAFTPSVQYVRNPAANPSQTDAWLFGFRTRWTF
ncbi:carbohydrate porin [Ruegeria sediminis]|uniref:Carbohydrate porin n=1 Tax=Ruegeria sediminis TaxID=2583820 RepID=A0ABY2WXD8_9RHOB|nr:carbohydrate porin [Ruegeria sediminis]TMV07526.1 carbohydrate porin [Ruegeria sediminis]